MKNLLLFIFIGLPTFLLAQPTLTFTPANNATNVSTTDDLTIASDEALKTELGADLNSTNVDALISLEDDLNNNALFDATVDPSRKTITITLSSPLAESTKYTLTLQPVKNNSDQQTAVQIITFTTGDFSDPAFTISRGIDNTGSGFTFEALVSEDATVYYIVDQNNTTPTAANIKAGMLSDGITAAEVSGSFSVNANTNTFETISGLDFTTPVKFNIHFLAEDGSGRESTPTTRGLPLLNSSSIPPAFITTVGFNLRVNVDEAVTTYYVVTQSATAPTASQILAGLDESGVTATENGNFAVSASTNEDHTITGLDDQSAYYVHFVSIDGAGNQTVVQSHSATTTDGTRPLVDTRTPADGSTGVEHTTNTFTITFDENVTTINTPATDDAHRVRLFENGVQVEAIDRDDVTIGTSGAISADGSSATATITFVHDLIPNKNYYILVGGDVFEDLAGNDFIGYPDASDWNFSSSGVTINNATSDICPGSFQSIENIIISESSAADFNTGTNQTLVLSLADNAEFAFFNSGIVISGTSADITSLSVSAGVTSITITYTVAGETVVDNITLSGLKVYATGRTAGTTIIRTDGTADQDGNNGTGASSLTYATINAGGTAPAQPQLAPSQVLIHCAGDDLSAQTITLLDQSPATYNWYDDPSLSSSALVISTASETVNLVSDLNLPTPAVAGTRKFYVVAVDACQSAPAVEVAVQIGTKPVADAGPDLIGDDKVCSGTELTLGGNPTLSASSAPGDYEYGWEYAEGTPEPATVANPTFTVTNPSTTAVATYNFQVTITDDNGCVGTDVMTVEVKPTFNISLISPNSYTFTPNSPNQSLQASPSDGVFSGVGVVQTNAPSTYQFSPSIAHATDPNTIPKNFNIYYTATKDGCTIENYLIANFTIANSFFAALQPEYCSSEYPDANTGGVALDLDGSGQTYVNNRKTSWNNSERFSRVSYPVWQSGSSYSNGTYVRHNNEIYRCAGGLFGCLFSGPPDAGAPWVYENIMKVTFKGLIRNYYEDLHGGNDGTPTVVDLGTTYTLNGETYNHYRFATNVNYYDCASCSYAWPAAYLEFERPEDIRLILPQWGSTYYYYNGDLVQYGSNVYQCTATNYTTGTQPDDANSTVWVNVTNSNYSNGQYFHIKYGSVYRSGFYVNGQYVQINRNPTVFFSGLADTQEVCQFDVLDLDNQSASVGTMYDLTGNFSNLGFVQKFFVSLDGSGGTFDDGGGAIVNDLIKAGLAKFDTRLAFGASDGSTVKNVKIKYQVDPGTDGSDALPCYGTSTITVHVRQNSAFDFDDTVVDDDGSIYCYTEAAKGLRSVFGGTPINGAAGTANSVTYSGDGVNNLGNSLGAFRPGLAVDQISPGTSVQQSVPVTALYRDANQCRSTRVRTFKVNPDIEPSFTFGGRANYCYEDITNTFTGHFQDFTLDGSTVTSTGRYDFVYKDPGGTLHPLQTVNTNNTDFVAQTFYDQIQGHLATTFPSAVNQPVNVDVIYTETLAGPGKTCFETSAQTMVINPPVVLDIFGLNAGDVLCRNDNSNVSQGNLVTFEGSVSGFGVFKLDDDADFTATNPTLNSTVNTNAGRATINLLNAYNAALDVNDPRQVFLQYEYAAPGCTGAADIIKQFKISPPPPITFDFMAGTPDGTEPFCNDDAVIQLKTDQATNVVLSGFGVTDSGTGDGTATFDPALAFNTSVSNGGSVNAAQNIMVTARITDAVGCANFNTLQYTVNPIPSGSVDIDPSELNYCYEDTPRQIQGTQSRSWYTIEYVGVTTPFTDHIGDINNHQSQFTFDPKARFDHATNSLGASALSPVNFNVYYTIADNDNCINTLGPYTLAVANQIEVSIAGIDNGEIYCSNEDNGVKVLTFNPFPTDASKRTFTINGQNTPLASDKYSFNPGLAGGDFELKYAVISGSNCTNTDITTIKALPSPKAVFSVDPACKDDLIDYVADGTGNLSSATYTWTFSGEVKTGQSVQHMFPGVSSYYAKLKVEHPPYAVTSTQTLVCSDSLQLDQVVGPYPDDIDFTFSNVCENDQTSFAVSSTIPINRVSWDFGDGQITDFGILSENIPVATYPLTSGTYESPIHEYSGANDEMMVRVYGKTSNDFGGCESVKERVISILQKWAPSPNEPIYDMSKINDGAGAWVVEDKMGNATWEFNTAAKVWINTEEKAWVTGATQPYNGNDVSYVNSPCFDLTGFTRPVLSIKHWTDTEASDGAVLQYSVDGGKTWVRLGDVASGLDWYNRLTISSNPGGQIELSSGWSLSNQEQWAVGKHTLDVLPAERSQVRFRIAFSSFNNREKKDGFAFNNVVIEERNRTILVENFTTLNPEQESNNEAYRAFRTNINGSFNQAELVKLQYHHASARNEHEHDELHEDNPVDQNARAAFYGVTNPVRAFVDGAFGQTSTNATFESPDIETYFSLRSLVTSPVDIAIDFLDEPADKLNVKATVQATDDVGLPGEYNVFVAIAEQEVLGQSYVLRKLLPDASGTPLTSLTAADPAQEINLSYDMRHITRLDNGEFAPFAVIVFVQNLQTKDILQTEMRQDGVAPPDIVTGVETPFDNYFRLYPNPADEVINIILPAPVMKETPIKLFDHFGKEIFSDAFKTGEHIKILPTKEFAAGVYLIQFSLPEGIVRKKAIIVHD